MDNNNNMMWVWIVAAIIVIAGLFYWFTMREPAVDTGASSEVNGAQTTPTDTIPNESGSNINVGAEVSVGAPVTITFSDSGVSPANVTIKRGQTVKFVNNATRSVWPASDEHPTHTKYAGTSRTEHCPDTANVAFDACRGLATGESWEFTFAKAGSWDYHDHMRASVGGVITVTQ